jgi:hypothetical protein
VLLEVQNRNTRRRTCPSANYSTTDLTGTELGLNPGLGWETPANDGLGSGRSAQRDVCGTACTFGSDPQRILIGELFTGKESGRR